MQFNGVEYSPAYTKKGDTLETLAAAFSVSPKDIVEANNVYWTRPLASAQAALQEWGIEYGGLSESQIQTLVRINDINQWVYSVGGRCIAFSPSASFLGKEMVPCTGGGYAVFSDSSQIFLPARTRKPVPPKIPGKSLLATMTPPSSPSYAGFGWGGALVVAGVAFLWWKNSKKGRK